MSITDRPAPDRLAAVTSGVVAAVVGFASSFAVVLQGLAAVGATPAQAASGLTALSVAMGLGSIGLSLRARMPITVAWSTPGAALLAAGAGDVGGFPAAIGAFLLSAALIVLAGLWRRLGTWVAAVPAPLANAMLAGVLLPLCLAPVRAVTTQPVAVLAVVATWVVVAQIRRLYAVPAAVVVAVGFIAVEGRSLALGWRDLVPHPVAVVPHLSVAAVLGVALPLALATMASQNVPGIAVLGAYGYHPEPAPLFRATGVLSLLAAPFGGHAVNLAAITAALCASPDAGADPDRRHRAAVVSGACWIVIGLLGSAAVAVAAAAPPGLIETVAGLALLAALGNALRAATAAAEHLEVAAVTFVITASGVTIAGVGGAFWGLVAGGGLYALKRWREGRPPAPSP